MNRHVRIFKKGCTWPSVRESTLCIAGFFPQVLVQDLWRSAFCRNLRKRVILIGLLFFHLSGAPIAHASSLEECRVVFGATDVSSHRTAGLSRVIHSALIETAPEVNFHTVAYCFLSIFQDSKIQVVRSSIGSGDLVFRFSLDQDISGRNFWNPLAWFAADTASVFNYAAVTVTSDGQVGMLLDGEKVWLK